MEYCHKMPRGREKRLEGPFRTNTSVLRVLITVTNIFSSSLNGYSQYCRRPETMRKQSIVSSLYKLCLECPFWNKVIDYSAYIK